MYLSRLGYLRHVKDPRSSVGKSRVLKPGVTEQIPNDTECV